MKHASETERLANAINSLARVIASIIAEKVQRLEAESERMLKESPLRSGDPILNKKQLAQRLNIGERTVTDWMNRRKIPYMKLGHSVRFRWSEVEQCLKRLEVRSRY